MDTTAIQNMQSSLSALNVAAWIVVVLLLFVLLFIFSVVRTFNKMMKVKASNLVFNEEANAFQGVAKRLLAESKYEKVKDLCAERRKSFPGDSFTYYYLAMAHYRCREWVDAKRYFELLPTLNADWKAGSEKHLELIASELKKSKPTLVNEQP